MIDYYRNLRQGVGRGADACAAVGDGAGADGRGRTHGGRLADHAAAPTAAQRVLGADA